MKENVYKYFENLKEKKLNCEKDYFFLDEDKISRSGANNNRFSRSVLLNICGTKYFAKDVRQKSESCQLLSPVELGSTQMYNHLGMFTPPANIVDSPLFPSRVYLATQDVASLKDYTVTIASKSKVAEITKDTRYIGDKQWDLLYNKKTQDKLHECMTEDCFEKFISLFLLDEIRTECDRHQSNFFFIKHKNAKKYEDIIPIDNEFAQVAYNQADTADKFKDFLEFSYLSETPSSAYFDETFINRMNGIKQLLHEGKLTPAQIALIKKELQYNLPKAIKEGSHHPELEQNCQDASNAMSYIWEYHHGSDGLARELGL